MLRFKASEVGFLEDHLGCAVLVLAEVKTGVGHTLEIQRAHEFGAQSRELGMDTYCLVMDGTLTVYGGLTSFSIEKSTLVLQLSEHAAKVMGTNGIEVKVPAKELTKVESALPLLLRQ